MNALEKAKLALREHLLQNKEQDAADLMAMREKSTGNDIFKYVNNLSAAYDLNHLTVSEEVPADYGLVEEDCFDVVEESPSSYVPQKNETEQETTENITLKDSTT